MEILIKTETPTDLKELILSAVELEENNEFKTWGVRKGKKHGKILTHIAEQYEDRALLVLQPDEDNKKLKVFLIKWDTQKEELDYAIKAIYIGRFCQAVLTHFGDYFSNISITK